jgi:glycosyltransferase involved in cell wall biosynthesis
MVMPAVKRLLRPLIPDRIMARYRLHQHSRDSRWNVDVFVTDQARKWVNTTPDTYRVRRSLPQGEPVGPITMMTDPSAGVDDDLVSRARQMLADPWLSAGVVAEVDEPGLVSRRRAEPMLGPLVIAVREEVLDEVGGLPDGPHPLPALLARLRDAGHPTGLIPVPVSGAPIHRTDPIVGDAIVILAAVPMHDVGGGARSTQLALEFIRQGFHVTLVSLYGAQESVDLGIRFIHPRLEQHMVERFRPSEIGERVEKPGLVLVEAPARPLIAAAFQLKDAGWRLVYDVVDDWSDPALGGEWFSAEMERALASRADRVTASAPDLVDRVWRMGHEATLVPNAVNAEVFGVDLPPRPADLPESGLIIGYHGSLYGDWLDWESLRAVAEAFPEAAVVVIGDDKAARPVMPPNVHFLGLKPQTDLPAYLQRFDVGILPFKLNDTTHAVSPLKAYEYLASGVPVAAPPLRSLDGLDGVVTGPLPEAVAEALAGSRPDRARAIDLHSWTARVARFMPRSGFVDGRTPVSIVLRPVVHWGKADRRVS